MKSGSRQDISPALGAAFHFSILLWLMFPLRHRLFVRRSACPPGVCRFAAHLEPTFQTRLLNLSKLRFYRLFAGDSGKKPGKP